MPDFGNYGKAKKVPDWLAHIQAQDSVGLQDATIPLVGNTMMLTSPTGSVVNAGINTLKSGLGLARSKGSVGDYLNAAYSAATPFAGGIQQKVKGVAERLSGKLIKDKFDPTLTRR